MTHRPTFGQALDRVDSAFDRRFTGRPGAIVLVELFLALGWTRSAVAKIVSSAWWSGTELRDFAVAHEADVVPWFGPVVDPFIVSTAALWAIVILLAECAVAVSLVRSRRVELGLSIAIALNVGFILAGATNPSVFYVVLQLMLVLWLVEYEVEDRRAARLLRWIAVLASLSVIPLIPFITTLAPAEVIEDPAGVLVTLAACTALTATAVRRRVRRRVFRQEYEIDLRESTPRLLSTEQPERVQV